MELIYLYIGKLESIFENFEINLSRNYEVLIEGSEIKILKTNSKNNIKYYGKNISSCNLLLGKNGSGKSTILNLLGYTKRDLFNKYGYKDNWFFKIYKRSNNEFLIEAFGREFVEKFKFNIDVKLLSAPTLSIISSVDDNCYLKKNEIKLCMNKEMVEKTDDHCHFFYLNKGVKNTSDHMSLTYKTYLNFSLINVFDYLKSKQFKQLKDFYNKKVNFILNSKLISRSFYDFKLYEKNIENISGNGKKIVGNYQIEEFNELFVISFLEKLFYYFLHRLEFELQYDDFKKKIYCSLEQINFDVKLDTSYENRKKYLLTVIENVLIKNALDYDEVSEFDIPLDINEIKKLIVGLEKIIDEYPHRDFNKSQIDISRNYDDIREFLDFYHKLIKKNSLILNLIKIEIGELSHGEFELIKILSMIYNTFEIVEQKLKEKIIDLKSIYILFDEIENHLHPELSRNIINLIIETIDINVNELNEKYDVKLKVNLIIASHSAFFCTDFIREDITKLVVNEKTKTRCTVKSKFGLLSNINDILYDDFFLDLPFGEYAKIKLFSIRDQIKNINFESSNVELSEIKSYIDLIDNELIKNQMLKFYNNKIESITNLCKNERIQLLERELKILKGE